MAQYYYFPILKTRPSEVNAYDTLDNSIKNEILPIIEMTGELGYTYTQKCKDESKRGTKRPGDINKKIKKIMDFMGERRFILDITDDTSLKYDGLSNKADGLLNPENGYKNWRNFLAQNADFKKQVIPTIQFQTQYIDEVKKQIEELDREYDFLAIKLRAFTPNNDLFAEHKNPIPSVINYIYTILNSPKLFLILDFDDAKNINNAQIEAGLDDIDLSKLKALIPVSSSFPSSVANAGNPPLTIRENDISDCVKKKLNNNPKIYHGDYSSIYPTRYEMGGAGWFARIDYIIREQHTKKPQGYDYKRGNNRNKSSEYVGLATSIVGSPDYIPISELQVYGDIKIAAKAVGGIEGKAPSYWITVRSNLYMTMQYLYLKKHGSFLIL